MRALVLAGGKGTRLSPLTPAMPKPFAPVGNKPVLSWVLEHLDTAGIESIAVVVAADDIEWYRTGLGTRTSAGTPLLWLGEAQPLGSAGALRAQAAFFKDGPVLVVPADILCPVDLPALIDQHQRRQPAVTVAVMTRDLSRWDGDTVATDPGGTTTYLFKPGAAAPSPLGSTGTWIIDPALLDIVAADVFTDLSRDVLPLLPTATLRLEAFVSAGTYLRDVGTRDTLLAANLEVVTGRSPVTLPPGNLVAASARIDLTARVLGQVLIGEHARIEASAVVTGPAVIGAATIVGQNARVERCVLLPGAVVDAGQQMCDQVYGDPHTAMRAMTERVAR